MLRAGVLNMTDFGWTTTEYLVISLLELLQAQSPNVFTATFVNDCARWGNLAAIKYIHDRAEKLVDGLFTSEAMDNAARHGHLAVIQFLHEHRTEGCTPEAVGYAARFGYLDVVKFLFENYTEAKTQLAINETIYEACEMNQLAIAQYLAEHITDLLFDPTLFRLNEAGAFVRAVWATTAITSGNPEKELRAAVIQLTELEDFKKVHNKHHSVGCRSVHTLLHVAIESKQVEFVKWLVVNCEHARASISFADLMNAGFDFKPANLELVELLVTHGFQSYGDQWQLGDFLQKAARNNEFDIVKLLLKFSVPCSEHVLMSALEATNAEPMVSYLFDRYPHFITVDVMMCLVCGDEQSHELFYRLHESRRRCRCDGHVLDSALTGRHVTLKLVRFMYEHCANIALQESTASKIWTAESDDVLVFMALMWRDPKIVSSFAAADRELRILVYSRLRACVPSLFASVSETLPWCCQLRCLRRRVQCGELTVADVESVRAE